MLRNPVKQKLREGKAVVGTWLNFPDASCARMVCRAGFEYVCVDMEHSAFDWSTASAIFGFAASAGCVPLCRVPYGDEENIKRALDAGAFGIVAPMVDTPEHARAIVDACYYPPFGRRSVGYGLHFLNFGTSDADYKEKANSEILCVLMIESPLGVSNADAIMSVPGVDAIFVGPNDLRFQMTRTLPDGRMPKAEEFDAARAEVHAAGVRTGVSTGVHTFSIEECKKELEKGSRFLAILSDVGFMNEAMAKTVREVGIVRDSMGGSGAVAGGLGKY